MNKTMADSKGTFDQLDTIGDNIDELRRELGVKIEMER